MPDFPSGLPDIPDAVITETLFTMHDGAGHVPTTNRMIENLLALATKLGSGASTPGAGPGVLRRTAPGQSGWGLIQSTDIQNGAIGLDQMASSIITSAQILDGSIQTIDLAPNAVTSIHTSNGSGVGGTTGPTPVTIPQMAISVPADGATWFYIAFNGCFAIDTHAMPAIFDLYINGGSSGRRQHTCAIANGQFNVSFSAFSVLPAGGATVEMRFWMAAAGSVAVVGDQRHLAVIALKR